MTIRFALLDEGSPAYGAAIGVEVFPSPGKRPGIPLATSSFSLPDYRTEPVVNQLEPYGFTGLQGVYYRGKSAAIAAVRYFCRSE